MEHSSILRDYIEAATSSSRKGVREIINDVQQLNKATIRDAGIPPSVIQNRDLVAVRHISAIRIKI